MDNILGYKECDKVNLARIYNIYKNMLCRCYRKENENYRHYGARDISVCDEWKNDRTEFALWAINNGYRDGLTIDRIDNDGNYCPENCRWADIITQNNNSRRNFVIIYNDKKFTLSQLAREFGILPRVLKYRLYHNWNIDELSLKTN